MDGPCDDLMPNGMAWNRVYDPEAESGFVPPATTDQLWSRLGDFLDACLSVAEKAGVTLALHPDDPPMPVMRGQPRLVYHSDLYQRLIDMAPGTSNQLEFCIGTIAEMAGADVYNAVDRYSKLGRVAYVHLRNVRGCVPDYRETFIDDGEVDIRRVLHILHDNGFEGVVIPDHTPLMSCAAPWHAGMAYAMGYIKAGLDSLPRSRECPGTIRNPMGDQQTMALARRKASGLSVLLEVGPIEGSTNRGGDGFVVTRQEEGWTVTGTNARSCLWGVYHLRENGGEGAYLPRFAGSMFARA